MKPCHITQTVFFGLSHLDGLEQVQEPNFDDTLYKLKFGVTVGSLVVSVDFPAGFVTDQSSSGICQVCRTCPMSTPFKTPRRGLKRDKSAVCDGEWVQMRLHGLGSNQGTDCTVKSNKTIRWRIFTPQWRFKWRLVTNGNLNFEKDIIEGTSHIWVLLKCFQWIQWQKYL